MGVVLDLPLAADQGQQPGRGGPVWHETRDPGPHFLTDLSRFFEDDLALQSQHLRQPWPGIVSSPHVTGLQPALRNTAMPKVQSCCRRTPLSRSRGQGKHGRKVVQSLGGAL